VKALTICQPYAHLIVTGHKRVENREWFIRYRGPLVIHAGKSRAWLGADDPSEPMDFGCVIGQANLVDCRHIDAIERGDCHDSHPWLRTHPHTNGTWCWVLADVMRFDPIPHRGAQGLWEFPDCLLPAHRRRALWIDTFGQRYESQAGGYTPGQHSPTGSRLIRFLD
jgi:hypothetical protein